MIVFFILGLLACCGASFYMGIHVAQADFDDAWENVDEEAWVEMLQRLVRARRAGRRLAFYWKKRVLPDGMPDRVFEETKNNFERGKGPCRRCGLRAWKNKVTAPDSQRLLCAGCGADHEAWH